MNRKYTKKQLLEAITYWKGQLRKLNEDMTVKDNFVVACDGEIVTAAEIEEAVDNTDIDLDETGKQSIDGVETYVFDNEVEAGEVADLLGRINGDLAGRYNLMQV